MYNLLYQGHASFRLVKNNDFVMYVDPFAGEGYTLPADVILCSHGHIDHCSTDIVPKKPDCRIRLFSDLLKDGEYKSETFSDVTVRAVPAYNEKHAKETTVGFLITAGGKKLYFASDTSKIPEMSALPMENIDYAFLPIDGFFNMGPEEAEECARIINAKYTVPIHTCNKAEGIFKESQVAEFNPTNKYVMRPGDLLEW